MFGGGVAYSGTHTWNNCQIMSNRKYVIGTGGGAVSYSGSHTWNNCIISGNSSDEVGGVSYSGTHSWNNCQIIGNSAVISVMNGKGAVSYSGTHTWRNCVINKNTAIGGVAYYPRLTLINCTISMNSTTPMFYDNSTSYKVTANNSIFAGVLLAGGNYADNTYTNCLFSLPTSSYTATFSQSIVADPQFINDQLEVSENAISIGAGSISLWLSNSGNVTSDYKGNPRIIGTIDLGAYEKSARVMLNSLGYYYLEEALAVANPGSIIEIITTNYDCIMPINWPNIDNITLRPGASLTQVTLNGVGTTFVTHVNNVGLRMNALTLTGFGSGSQSGPVFNHNGLTTPRVELNNVIIKGNKGYYGGVTYYGTYTWNNCQIVSNNSSRYGGVTYYGIHTWNNCQILSNTNTMGYGGGVSYYGTHTWNNCQIVGNKSPQTGGVANNGTHTWTNCQIVSNNADEEGGIVYDGAMNGMYTWNNCLIVGNTAGRYAFEGRGGVAARGTLTFRNCVINNNIAGDRGSVVGASAKVLLINCTISANNTTREMFYNNGGVGWDLVTAYNSILAGKLLNLDGYSNGGIGDVFTNCIFSQPTSSYTAPVFSQSIVTVPPFINEQLEVSENALSWNAGSNSLWLSNSGNVTSDYKGYPRVKNTIDLGAYELMRPDMSSTYIDTRSNRYQPTITIAPVEILVGEPPISFYEWYIGTDPAGTTITKTGGASIVPTMLRYNNYVRARAVNSIGLRGLWKTVVKYFLIPFELQYY